MITQILYKMISGESLFIKIDSLNFNTTKMFSHQNLKLKYVLRHQYIFEKTRESKISMIQEN